MAPLASHENIIDVVEPFVYMLLAGMTGLLKIYYIIRGKPETAILHGNDVVWADNQCLTYRYNYYDENDQKYSMSPIDDIRLTERAFSYAYKEMYRNYGLLYSVIDDAWIIIRKQKYFMEKMKRY